MVGAIVSLFGGKLKDKAVDIFHDVLDGTDVPPEKQMEFEAKIRAMEAEETKVATEAAGAVLKAEATSTDGFVRRARPTFLYLMYVVLGINFALVPLVKLFGVDMEPAAIPKELYALFGSGYLGYGLLRSKDKGTGSWKSLLGLK